MNLIPFAGALVAFLLAASHWMETWKKDKIKNQISPVITQLQSRLWFVYLNQYTSTVLFLTLGILQIHIYAELTGEIKYYPYFFGFHIPCLFLIGPLSYIYFEEMSGGEFYKIRILHFLPSLVSLFYIFLFRPTDLLLASDGLMNHNHNHNANFPNVIHCLLGFAVLSIFVYTFSIFMRVFRWKLSSKEKLESSFFPFISLLSYSLFVVLLFVISQLFFMKLFLVACLSLTILLIVMLLFKLDHKEMIPNFKSEVRSARYKASRLRGLNINQILQRLNDLMITEQIYLNENLSLLILSKRLDLNTHQLSEILNFHLGCTFRNYVNQFRLQEAARLLLEKPDMTILSVIYASGFNSKSSFHKLFIERFGQSPQNYRSLKK